MRLTEVIKGQRDSKRLAGIGRGLQGSGVISRACQGSSEVGRILKRLGVIGRSLQVQGLPAGGFMGDQSAKDQQVSVRSCWRRILEWSMCGDLSAGDGRRWTSLAGGGHGSSYMQIAALFCLFLTYGHC